MKGLTIGVCIFASTLLAPLAVRAQSSTTGAIAGVARDTTGAVLPGVTVEAESSALIEKVRVAITDGQGNYKILDLRPGTYSVTFTLPGFSIFKRDGLELSTGVTATANAEMRVGTVEETVTVTGATPVVDVQNVRTQTVFTQEVLEALPASRSILSMSAVTLGATNISSQGAPILDVGGSKGDGTTFFEVHGTRRFEQRMLYDGLSENIVSGGDGDRRLLWTNAAAVQETVVVTGGGSPEMETAGMTLNAIPREGSNRFTFRFSGDFTNEDLQNDNLTSEIRGRGLTTLPGVKKIYDVGAGIGGPIAKDRLWFYSANRRWTSQEYQPGAFSNASSNPFLYVADTGRPGFTELKAWDMTGRLTWQAAEKHKITGNFQYQQNCQCNIFMSATRSPEGAPDVHQGPLRRTQLAWTHAASNRVLIEAGLTINDINWTPRSDEADYELPRIVDGVTGVIYGNSLFGIGAGGPGLKQDSTMNQRASVTYVQGSHALKVGQLLLDGTYEAREDLNAGQLFYVFLAGRPVRITQHATPFTSKSRLRTLAFYAQDQWTVNRATFNLGLRFDHAKGWVPAGTREGGLYLDAFSYDRVDNVPNFKDIVPRLGAAYDVFGGGRTAVKGFIGRYESGVGVNSFTDPSNPARNVVLSANRTWLDGNGNFVPDCDLRNRAANGECFALDNSAFGQPSQNTFYDDNVVEGWGNRGYHWQGTVALQHQLRPGLGLSVSYFRTWYSNFTVSQNTLVAPESFSSYCLTAPVDSRLPGGGGNQICGLYDVNPGLFGRVRNLVTPGEPFGEQVEKFDGVDVGLSWRFGRGGLLNGGVSLGRKVTDSCYANDRPDITPFGYTAGTPRSSDFCNVTPPWSAGTQVKLNGVYPLPYGIESSFTFQNLAGVPLAAAWAVPNATILSSSTLGRSLSSGGSVDVQLIPSSNAYLARVTQLDLRFAKLFQFGGGRVRGTFDIYNLANTATILSVVTSYGPAWQRPSTVQGGRLFKFGAQVDF